MDQLKFFLENSVRFQKKVKVTKVLNHELPSDFSEDDSDKGFPVNSEQGIFILKIKAGLIILNYYVNILI